MAGFFKNLMNERKKTASDLILDARIKLDEATTKFLFFANQIILRIEYPSAKVLIAETGTILVPMEGFIALMQSPLPK